MTITVDGEYSAVLARKLDQERARVVEYYDPTCNGIFGARSEGDVILMQVTRPQAQPEWLPWKRVAEVDEWHRTQFLDCQEQARGFVQLAREACERLAGQ